MSGDWRSDLARFARDTRAMFRRHRWLASVAFGTPPLGPNALRQDELTMAAMSSLGVDLQTQGAIGAVVYFFVIGFVLRELAQEQLQQRTGVSIQEWRARSPPTSSSSWPPAATPTSSAPPAAGPTWTTMRPSSSS